MGTRTVLWAVPVGIAAAITFSGCQQTAAEEDEGLPAPAVSTEICNAPNYIRAHAPEGLCGDEFDAEFDEVAADPLAPTGDQGETSTGAPPFDASKLGLPAAEVETSTAAPPFDTSKLGHRELIP